MGARETETDTWLVMPQAMPPPHPGDRRSQSPTAPQQMMDSARAAGCPHKEDPSSAVGGRKEKEGKGIRERGLSDDGGTVGWDPAFFPADPGSSPGPASAQCRATPGRTGLSWAIQGPTPSPASPCPCTQLNSSLRPCKRQARAPAGKAGRKGSCSHTQGEPAGHGHGRAPGAGQSLWLQACSGQRGTGARGKG